MAVTLWPYNVSTKGFIVEDAVNNCREIMFYSGSGGFELIQGGNQIIIPSFDDFKKMIAKENIHLLCPSLDACKKLETLLKKHKVPTVFKKETYIL